MSAPLERARGLVADARQAEVIYRGVPLLGKLTEEIGQVAAIAAAGLALRDACREAQNAGGTDYDFHRRMLDARDSYDADIVKAMAESEGE